ncbi:atlastin-3-like [Watersipora subatra]|uniref:atlastin-3-like n=1 Tax=Watersipora subatra TaxID=2589382 RepID=UPI00355B3B0C
MGSEESKPQAIIQLTKQGPQYDIPVFKQLLKQVPGNKDTKVHVISISGKYRSGKSFLLNLFKIYLDYYSQFETDDGWTVARDIPIRGWEWRKCQIGVTHGIWMYVYPKIVNKKAIILLDCQGYADPTRSDPTLDNLILFIALQLGDVHILNVNQTFGNEDLSQLSVCALHADDDATGYIFQRNVVLVRNWEFDERPMTLEEMYKVTESASAKDELKGIMKAFRIFGVETLPHPGKTVGKADETAGITIGDADEEFLEEAANLFLKLLFPMSVDSQVTSIDLLLKFQFLSKRSVGKVLSPKQAYEESVIKTICEQLRKEFEKNLAEQRTMLEKSAKAGSFAVWRQLEAKLPSMLKDVMEKYNHHPSVERCANQGVVNEYRNFIKAMYQKIVTIVKCEYEAREAKEKLQAKEKLVADSERKLTEANRECDRATAEKHNLARQMCKLQGTVETLQQQKRQQELNQVNKQLKEAEETARKAKQAREEAQAKLMKEKAAQEKAKKEAERAEAEKEKAEKSESKCCSIM